MLDFIPILRRSALSFAGAGLRRAALAVTIIMAAAHAFCAVTVQSVTSTLANGTYTAGDRIDIQVKWSAAVTVRGGATIPYLVLNTSPQRTATYNSGSGSATTVFRYTVQTGDTSADLDYLATGSLMDPSSKITAGSGVSLTLPSPGAAGSLSANKNIVVDAAAPTVLSITPKGGSANPTNATSVQYTVVFSETVSNVTTGRFTATRENGTVAGTVSAVSAGSGSSIDVTVSSITGNGDLRLDLASVGSIQDAAGNALAATFNAGDSLTFDHTTPTVTSIVPKGVTSPSNATTVQYTVTFGESVKNVSVGNFSVTGAGGVAGTVSAVSAGSGTSIDVTVSSITGNGTLRLDLSSVGTMQDTAGNALSATYNTGQSITFDHSAPTVVSMVRKSGSTNPTNAASVDYTVTFSENVKNLAVGNFSVTGTGGVTGTVSAVSAATGSSINVTVNSVTGSGDLKLNLSTIGTIQDDAGNVLSATYLAGEAFTFDHGAPSVSSIVPKGVTSPTNATSVQYTVTFSESVKNVATGNFTLTSTGGAAGTISAVSSSTGSIIDVTVNAITGNGTLRLDLSSKGTIQDSVGNALSNTFNTGQAITFDHTAPTVTGIVRKSGSTNPTNATSVQYTVTFSESVNNIAIGNFSVTGTGGVTGTVSTVSAASGASVDVTVSSITGSGDLRLDLSSKGTIQDSAANALSATYSSGQSFTFDHVVPSVTSISRKTGSTNPSNATSAVYTVAFNKSVKNVSVANFAAVPASGSAAGTVSAVSVSTGSSIDVTVSSISGTGDLRLDLSTVGTIQDSVGNLLSGPFTTGQTFTFDHTAPIVVSVTRKSGSQNPTNDLTVAFTVTFSEPVTNIDTSCFSVKRVDGVIWGMVIGVSASSGTTIDVTALAFGDGEYRLNVDTGTNIQDLVGNLLSSGYTSGETYTFDIARPTVTSITRKSGSTNPTKATSVEYTVTFSESVNNVSVGNFAATRVNGTVSGTVSAISVTSASSVNVTVSSITGDGDLRLDLNNVGTIQDLAGNAMNTTFNSGQSYTFDHTPPAVVSINRKSGSTNPSKATSVVYTVTFSEAVSNVGVANFVATRVNGTVSGTVSGVSASSGSSIDVTVTPVSGDGDLRLDLNAVGTIQDSVGNLLSGPFSSGQSFTFDHTSPTVVSINRKSGSTNPSKATSVAYTVTFSEPVSNVGVANFAATRVSGTVSGTVSAVSASSGSSIDVTVTPVSGDGDLRLDLSSVGTIQDSVANLLSAPYTAGQSFTFDHTAPAVVSITRKSGSVNPTSGTVVEYTVAFSETVSNVTVSNFASTRVSGNVSGTVSAVSASSGSSIDVTVSSVSGEGDLRLDLSSVGTIQDNVGNLLNGAFTTGQSYSLDHTPPTVVSIKRKNGSKNPTNGTSVEYTVSFSEDVTNIGPANFVVTSLGKDVSGTVSAVSAPKGSKVNVTVSSISGHGQLRLDLSAIDTIEDDAGNILASTYDGDEMFIVDTSAPVIDVFGPVKNATKNSLPSIEVTFNENVTGVTAADFTVAGSPATDVAGSGAGPYSFTGYATPADGTVVVSLASGGIIDDSGNAFAGDSWSYTKDSVNPVSSASVTDQTRAGAATLNIDFTASDAGSGVASTKLYVKAPGDADFADAGLEAQTGTAGVFVYTPAAGNGLYQFATRAVDNAGNNQAAPAFEDTHVLLNTVTNGAFVQTAQTDTDVLVFPMTDDLDVTITLTGAVAGETSLTVSRTVSPASFPAYFQHPEQLIQEQLTVTAGGTFTDATLDWQYETAGAPGVDRVYKFDGGAQPSAEYPVTPSGNTLTISGITSFSDFFAGNTVAVPVALSGFQIE